MSRITMQNFKEPYVALLREGTTEEPYVDITETVKIVPRIEESSLAPARKPIAILREIPVDTYGVSAIVKGDEDIELIEIRDSLTKPDATHFKVDYTNGRVYLSDDYKTGTIEFTYKGRGVICVTAQRVIVDTGGDANDVSTLADIIDMQLSELNVGNLNDLLTTDKDYVVDAINEVYTNAVNILSDLNAHKIDYLNPHQTTKEQVELGNVDNTSDINKPVSIAQKTYIDDADSILQDQINALRGSFIYIGSINLNTADVTQELLSARALEIMGGTTIELGWVLIDNEKHEWYYNANTTTWIDFEQPNIYQASNSIYGIVKGDGTDVSISDGIITVNNAGNASSLGGVVAANYATKEYVDANGGTVILLAVTDIVPTICAIGDVYFNTTTKLLYDCEVINTWGTGYTPNELKIYIDGSTNVSYYYDGDTLAMTGGDEIYIGEGEIVADNIKLIVDTEFIETKATEVINSIDVSSSVMAPSVDAVNGKINPLDTRLSTVESVTSKIITGELASNYGLTTTWVNIPYSNIINVNSCPITWDATNKYFVIGEGVSKIKVSITVSLYDGWTLNDTMACRLYRGTPSVPLGTNLMEAMAKVTASGIAYQTIGIGSKIVSVSEGDTILLLAHTLKATGNLKAQTTFITIEVVE